MSCGCAERREKISQAAQEALETVKELFSDGGWPNGPERFWVKPWKPEEDDVSED